MQSELVVGAFAYCWVVEDSATAALSKAEFYVTKDGWKITDDSEYQVEVTEEARQDSDIDAENFRKAQDQRIAIYYVARSRDGKTSAGPMPLLEDKYFRLDRYTNKQKKLNSKGRCLHFDSDSQCRVFINAHSIQKSGQLSKIADQGYVYAPASDIGTLKKNKGRVTFKKIGINQMSTFLGFCNKHDNEVKQQRLKVVGGCSPGL